jgi:hypothetical protein
LICHERRERREKRRREKRMKEWATKDMSELHGDDMILKTP